MRYGIYDIAKAIKDEHVVKCNNCSLYFYETSTDERNNNQLIELQEPNTDEIFIGCPVCKTDSFLEDI